MYVFMYMHTHRHAHKTVHNPLSHFNVSCIRAELLGLESILGSLSLEEAVSSVSVVIDFLWVFI